MGTEQEDKPHADPLHTEPLEEALRRVHPTARDQKAWNRVKQLAPDFDPLLEALQHEDKWVRRGAAAALGEVRTEWALESLRQALLDPERVVREQAAYALGSLGDRRAVTVLIGALNDPEGTVVARIANALGRIGDREAVVALIGVLSHEYHSARSSAAEALGLIRDQRAVQPLIAALRDDHYLVRDRAALALGKLGDPAAIPPLIAALEGSSGRVDEGRPLRWLNLAQMRCNRSLPPSHTLTLGLVPQRQALSVNLRMPAHWNPFSSHFQIRSLRCAGAQPGHWANF